MSRVWLQEGVLRGEREGTTVDTFIMRALPETPPHYWFPLHVYYIHNAKKTIIDDRYNTYNVIITDSIGIVGGGIEIHFYCVALPSII